MRMHDSHAHTQDESNQLHAHATPSLNDSHPHTSEELNQPHAHVTPGADESQAHTHDNSNQATAHTIDESQWVDEPEPVGWPRKVNMEAIFPPGEGRDLMLWNCIRCHTFVRIVLGHHTHSHGTEPGRDTHWDSHRILHGARLMHLSKEELDTLYAYLKANFNDTKPAPKLPSWLREYW